MTLKKTLSFFYILILVAMAAATVLGSKMGQDYATGHIYGSWWFCLLWAVLMALGVAWFVRSRVRRASVVLLHLSFIIILIGAAVTHFTSAEGMLHLRQGETATEYLDNEGQSHELPFSITLRSFGVSYHAGNAAAMDYASHITVVRNGEKENFTISMNHIYNRHGLRLYQSSYDEDMRGSWLRVGSDPVGIPLTYTGYALLFISLFWMLLDPRGRFRQLLRSPILKAAVLVLPLLSLPSTMKAQNALPEESAERFSRLFIVYNGRICPMETFARDFTTKLYGKAHYKNFSATQVLTGFMFWPEDWMRQPVMKVKGKALRQRLGLNAYASPAAFFTGSDGYVLGPWLQEAQGKNDSFSKQVLDTDDRLMLLMQVMQGAPMQIFPYTNAEGKVLWYAPVSKLPGEMPKAQQQYVRTILSLCRQLAEEGKTAEVNELLDKMLKYQHRYGSGSLPSPMRVKAERIYNAIPFATILFMANLTLALLSVVFLGHRKIYRMFTLLMALSWLALTFALGLRWAVSGNIPMNNGYETMLFMAWLIMMVSLVASAKVRLMTTFGLLMSGFLLLVSHIGEMDPAITPRMPVLNSPLLSIHVSIIMMSYALLALTFITSIGWIITSLSGKASWQRANKQMDVLSRLFLYPAMTCLGLGIFIGAIWANVSWGAYWSWDPKEVWALITFMLYATPIHSRSLPRFRRQRVYHVFIVFAFLSILITFFGVNYVLGGMHSYA